MPKREDPDVHRQIHHGRREKLRASFLKYGLESFNEVQVLEYALGLALPRIDTNPVAHRLINTFGSLLGVIEAHPDKLKEIDGIGENCAIFLSFLRQFATYMTRTQNQQKSIETPSCAIEHLRAVMGMYTNEEFVILCLDRRGKILLQEQIKGSESRVDMKLRDIVDTILRVRTNSVIFAHNHVDASANPSDADIQITRRLVNILRPLDVHIMDHLIFGKESVFSFNGKGLLQIFEREHKDFLTSKL